MLKLIISCDPGKTGGIVLMAYDFKEEKVKALGIEKMPAGPKQVKELLTRWVEQYPDATVFIEKLSIFPSDNEQPGKAFGIKKMLKNFEQLKAVLEMMDLKTFEVAAMRWQSYLKLRAKGVKETKTVRKRKYQAFAKEVFPGYKITLNVSDALCIAEYGRRKMMYEPTKYM